ncbi:DoxX family protein [Cytophagaceae bacterium DM2B3-1]|uniref:DoxX family protein n=1 Tax=Xanthocytophaga flava TaxID=3048013 RepID=A0ABT7CCX0_9BACT|nr:DoxX family protein [Xanthocytophaga flavus]MDJ1491457.1 DoxX family protein [Xanthocytophaga flavus]
MKEPVKIGHFFYGTALIVYGVQQFIYSNFRNVQFPAWQSYLPLLSIWAYLTGIGLVLAGVSIIIGKRGKEAALLVGGIFLFLFLFVHIPFELFGEVNSSLHLALWLDALKELALSGGAFVMAGSFQESSEQARIVAPLRFLEKLTPLGSTLFSIPMISFGIMHFLYADFVGTLVPTWWPDHLFWTYVTGVALIAAGTAIILKIRQGIIGLLFSIMLLFWVISLHIPRAIDEPFAARGNEVSSAFDALAFCGITWVIALRTLRRDLKEIFTK